MRAHIKPLQTCPHPTIISSISTHSNSIPDAWRTERAGREREGQEKGSERTEREGEKHSPNALEVSN